MHYLVDLTLLMHCRLSCISWYVWLTLQPLPRIPCWRHWRCIILYDFLWLLRHWSGSKTFHQGSVPLAFEVLQSFISWVGILPKCTNNISQQREKKTACSSLLKLKGCSCQSYPEVLAMVFLSGKVCVSVWVWGCASLKAIWRTQSKPTLPKSVFRYPFKQPTCNQ